MRTRLLTTDVKFIALFWCELSVFGNKLGCSETCSDQCEDLFQEPELFLTGNGMSVV